MQFNPENPVIKLCAQGMSEESKGNNYEAARLFLQAFDAATNDFEKFTAAHYVARHQETIAEKLKWDETALNLALKINDDSLNASYPSLYLNIAKCHEDLNDFENARKNYQQAQTYSKLLPDDAYGKMIKSGISNGMLRTATPERKDL